MINRCCPKLKSLTDIYNQAAILLQVRRLGYIFVGELDKESVFEGDVFGINGLYINLIGRWNTIRLKVLNACIEY